MRGRKKAVINDQVYLDTSAGLKRALKHITEFGDSVLSDYQKRRVRQFLKEYDNQDYSRAEKNDLNKRVQRWLGIKKDGSISKNTKKPIDFRLKGGRWTALVKTGKAKSKYTVPVKGVGDLMYNWDVIKSILKEFSILDYENDFLSGLYIGWINNLAARLNITGIDNLELLDWIFALLHWWDYEYQVHGKNWVFHAIKTGELLTEDDILKVGGTDISSIDKRINIELLELAFKRKWG